MPAPNQVVFRVIVSDDGTLRAVAEGLEDVRERSDQAGDGANRLRRRMDGVSRSSLNSTREFARQAQGMGGLVSIYATVAANVYALTSAFSLLRDAADFSIMRQASADLAASTGTNFAAVGAGLQEITNQAIGLKEAMQLAALGIGGGIDVSQLESLTTAATQAANALGRNVPEATNRMIQAVVKGEAELLDEFGIILRIEDATRQYADALGLNAKELTAFQRQQAIVNQVLEQAQQRYGDIEIRANPYQQLAVAFDALKRSVLDVMNVPLAGFIQNIADNSLLLASIVGIIAGKLVSLAIPALAEFGDTAARAAQQATENIGQASFAYEEYLALLDQIPNAAEQYANFDPQDQAQQIADIFTAGEDTVALGDEALRSAIESMQNGISTAYQDVLDEMDRYRGALDEAIEYARGEGEGEAPIQFGTDVEIMDLEALEQLRNLSEEGSRSLSLVRNGLINVSDTMTGRFMASMSLAFNRFTIQTTAMRATVLGAVSAAANTSGIVAGWRAAAAAINQATIAARAHGAQIGLLTTSFAYLSAAAVIAGRAIAKAFTVVTTALLFIQLGWDAIKWIGEKIGIISKTSEEATRMLEEYNSSAKDLSDTLDSTADKLFEVQIALGEGTAGWKEYSSQIQAVDTALKQSLGGLTKLAAAAREAGELDVDEEAIESLFNTIKKQMRTIEDVTGEPVEIEVSGVVFDEGTFQSLDAFESRFNEVYNGVAKSSDLADFIVIAQQKMTQAHETSVGVLAKEASALDKTNNLLTEYRDEVIKALIPSSDASKRFLKISEALNELSAISGEIDLAANTDIDPIIEERIRGMAAQFGLAAENVRDLKSALQGLQASLSQNITAALEYENIEISLNNQLAILKGISPEYDAQGQRLLDIAQVEHSILGTQKATLQQARAALSLKIQTLESASELTMKEELALALAKLQLDQINGRIAGLNTEQQIIAKTAVVKNAIFNLEQEGLNIAVQASSIQDRALLASQKLKELKSKEIEFGENSVAYIQKEYDLQKETLDVERQSLLNEIKSISNKIAINNLNSEESRTLEGQIKTLQTKLRINTSNLEIIEREKELEEAKARFARQTAAIERPIAGAEFDLDMLEASLALQNEGLSRSAQEAEIIRRRQALLQSEAASKFALLQNAEEFKLTEEERFKLQSDINGLTLESVQLAEELLEKNMAINEEMAKQQLVTPEYVSAYFVDNLTEALDNIKSYSEQIADILTDSVGIFVDGIIDGLAEAKNLKGILENIAMGFREMALDILKSFAKERIFSMLKGSFSDVPGMKELAGGTGEKTVLALNTSNSHLTNIETSLRSIDTNIATGGLTVSNATMAPTGPIEVKGDERYSEKQNKIAENQAMSSQTLLQGAGIVATAAAVMQDGSISFLDGIAIITQLIPLLMKMDIFKKPAEPTLSTQQTAAGTTLTQQVTPIQSGTLTNTTTDPLLQQILDKNIQILSHIGQINTTASQIAANQSTSASMAAAPDTGMAATSVDPKQMQILDKEKQVVDQQQAVAQDSAISSQMLMQGASLVTTAAAVLQDGSFSFMDAVAIFMQLLPMLMMGGGGFGFPFFADGGIVNKPTPAIVGEGGVPEAIIPMPAGKVPVELTGANQMQASQASTVNINQSFDFRNADPGSEAKLRKEAERIKRETFNMVFDKISEGGRYAKISGRRGK